MPAEDAALASAIRRQEERLARDPSSLAFAQLADLYRKVGRAAEAVALCRDGLARYPNYATARLILAKALLAEDRLEEALQEIGAILLATPGDAQCRRLAAELERRRGNVDAAVAHLEVAVRVDAGDRESRALLGLLRTDAGQDTGAGLGRVLRDDTFVTMAFASVCLAQGLVEEAVQVWVRLLRKNPEHPEATERLEQALRARVRRKG